MLVFISGGKHLLWIKKEFFCLHECCFNHFLIYTIITLIYSDLYAWIPWSNVSQLENLYDSGLDNFLIKKYLQHI